MKDENLQVAFRIAVERYAELGVDVPAVLAALRQVPLSLHCWQGDDVGGFEAPRATLSGGGIQVTGNHPGRARNVEELRADLEKVYSLLPGSHRLNLHAIYGEFAGRSVDRDAIMPEHYAGWIAWAKEQGLGLDFNPTCFSHPRADGGYTLAAKDRGTREFWLEHVQRCRAIGAQMGAELDSPCRHNLWIPDGAKDTTVDKRGHRDLLLAALDQVFAKAYPAAYLQDSLESKLFGIGSESFVVGSHEFYLGYAVSRKMDICLDCGHFHPTEQVSDKISALLNFVPGILLHLSRGVRWDSDHVVILNDEVRAILASVVRAGALERVAIALDFFDASLNRLGAWVTGARATMQALLLAMLEPGAALLAAEESGDYYGRMALLEELKLMPWGVVWDYYCRQENAGTGRDAMAEIQRYEQQVTLSRN